MADMDLRDLLSGLSIEEAHAAVKLSLELCEWRKTRASKVCIEHGVSPEIERWHAVADAAVAIMLRAMERA